MTTGNQLIECSECGSLYHQECHRPAITEQERGDTRSLWLCSSCRDQQSPSQQAAPVSTQYTDTVHGTARPPVSRAAVTEPATVSAWSDLVPYTRTGGGLCFLDWAMSFVNVTLVLTPFCVLSIRLWLWVDEFIILYLIDYLPLPGFLTFMWI